jgi:hypothetical protein
VQSRDRDRWADLGQFGAQSLKRDVTAGFPERKNAGPALLDMMRARVAALRLWFELAVIAPLHMPTDGRGRHNAQSSCSPPGGSSRHQSRRFWKPYAPKTLLRTIIQPSGTCRIMSLVRTIKNLAANNGKLAIFTLNPNFGSFSRRYDYEHSVVSQISEENIIPGRSGLVPNGYGGILSSA